MMKAGSVGRRAPIRAIGIKAARIVREALGYTHPMELAIDDLAFMRGALVRPARTAGARANLLRVGDGAVIAVAEGLSSEEQRWAIAHELGHFEALAGISYLGLCSSSDMLPSYEASGREPEANAFAAELLMPDDLFRRRCDVASVSWEPICTLADEFGVTATAAAVRFVEMCDERVAVVSAKDGVVQWVSASKDFGRRPGRGARVSPWSEAYDFFSKGVASPRPEAVSASAWIDDAADDEELEEHVLPMPLCGVALSLLWWRP